MPELTNELLLKLMPYHTITNQNHALNECDEYLKNKNIDINKISYSAIYFIISKLKDSEQANFIKDNINILKEHHEEIFLYNMLYPKSLCHFLCYESINEIYKLDKDIFYNIINRSLHGFIENSTSEKIYNFYNEYSDELSKVKDNIFITDTSFAKDKVDKAYNFTDLILNNYKHKINSFENQELLRFYQEFIQNDGTSFVNEYRSNFISALNKLDASSFQKYISSLLTKQREGLILPILEYIIQTPDDILSFLNLPTLIKTYKSNKEYFNKTSILVWIKASYQNPNYFNDELKQILNKQILPIDVKDLYKYNSKVNKYIEFKIIDSLSLDGKYTDTKEIDSIYSIQYFKNLKELNHLMKNNMLNVNDQNYTNQLDYFINYLMINNIIFQPTPIEFEQLKIFFYRLVKTLNFHILIDVASIQDIALINRLHVKEYNASDFSIEQITSYNIKDHKKLYKRFSNNFDMLYKKLTLKLLLLLGYKNANKLLDIDENITTLEHLLDNIDINLIKMDNNHNPILNKRLINLFFNDKNNPRIKYILENKDSLLYKYFPRLFNEYYLIKLSGQDKNLKTMIAFLESSEIHLPPRYYRLEKELKYIGITSSIVNEGMKIHDLILNRTHSSIPRVEGTINGYTYEILKLNDFEGLSVGNKTDCCFTIKGVASSSLHHALTSKNGRILIVKKDDKLLAHSWLWRNGDVLCLDNIEISKSISKINFFDVYLDCFEKILDASLSCEGELQCIKNITIGNCYNKIDFSNYKRIEKSNFKDLPKPIENVHYSDAKEFQYIIKGSTNFHFYQSEFLYQDSRNPIYYYDKANDEQSTIINLKVNALRQLKYQLKNKEDEFKVIDISDYNKVYCNDDFYIIIDNKNNIDTYLLENDIRSKYEFDNCMKLIFNKQR